MNNNNNNKNINIFKRKRTPKSAGSNKTKKYANPFLSSMGRRDTNKYAWFLFLLDNVECYIYMISLNSVYIQLYNYYFVCIGSTNIVNNETFVRKVIDDKYLSEYSFTFSNLNSIFNTTIEKEIFENLSTEFVRIKNIELRNTVAKSLRSFKLIRLSAPLDTSSSIPFDGQQFSKLQILNYQCLQEMFNNLFDNRPIFLKKYEMTNNYFSHGVYELLTEILFGSTIDYGYKMANGKTLAENIINNDTLNIDISDIVDFIDMDNQANVIGLFIYLVNHPTEIKDSLVKFVDQHNFCEEVVDNFSRVFQSNRIYSSKPENCVRSLSILSQRLPKMEKIVYMYILLFPQQLCTIGINSIHISAIRFISSQEFVTENKNAPICLFFDNYVLSLGKKITHNKITGTDWSFTEELCCDFAQKIISKIDAFEKYASIENIFYVEEDNTDLFNSVNILVNILIYSKIYPFHVNHRKLKNNLVKIFRVVLMLTINNITRNNPFFGYGTDIISYAICFYIANSEYFNFEIDLNSLMAELGLLCLSGRLLINLEKYYIYYNFLFALMNNTNVINKITIHKTSQWKDMWYMTLKYSQHHNQ